ncbi:hypothetical protein MSP8887_04003 [Marinomonas spartinae]|uniref:hypothetical protein n=1 Tax=Marinomonas spartinae TaxID=1792290 RepID=UPI000808ED83|nr:hypothetical protein [Marinomonas spartinae]SBS39783.1 hypothetical protein MSP8887_04003 [Marinomonas spartinae]
MPDPFINQRPQDVVARQRFKSRLEKGFKENQCHVYVLTKEEFTCLWLETQKFYNKTEAQIKEELSNLTGLEATDFILSSAGNYGSIIKDTPAFLALVNDFKRSGNILGRYDIIIRNGWQYVSFKGNPRLRNIITRSRYLLTHTKIINMGIGIQGLKSGAVGGFYIGVLFSTTLDTINWIFKDNYRWTNWLGTVSTDIVKAAIGAAATALAIAFAAVLFPSVVIGFIAGVVVGLYVGFKLNEFDKIHHMTDKVINALNYVEKRAPLLEDKLYKVAFNSAGEAVGFFNIGIDKVGKFYNNSVSQGLIF